MVREERHALGDESVVGGAEGAVGVEVLLRCVVLLHCEEGRARSPAGLGRGAGVADPVGEACHDLLLAGLGRFCVSYDEVLVGSVEGFAQEAEPVEVDVLRVGVAVGVHEGAENGVCVEGGGEEVGGGKEVRVG